MSLVIWLKCRVSGLFSENLHTCRSAEKTETPHHLTPPQSTPSTTTTRNSTTYNARPVYKRLTTTKSAEPMNSAEEMQHVRCAHPRFARTPSVGVVGSLRSFDPPCSTPFASGWGPRAGGAFALHNGRAECGGISRRLCAPVRTRHGILRYAPAPKKVAFVFFLPHQFRKEECVCDSVRALRAN